MSRCWLRAVWASVPRRGCLGRRARPAVGVYPEVDGVFPKLAVADRGALQDPELLVAGSPVETEHAPGPLCSEVLVLEVDDWVHGVSMLGASLGVDHGTAPGQGPAGQEVEADTGEADEQPPRDRRTLGVVDADGGVGVSVSAAVPSVAVGRGRRRFGRHRAGVVNHDRADQENQDQQDHLDHDHRDDLDQRQRAEDQDEDHEHGRLRIRKEVGFQRPQNSIV